MDLRTSSRLQSRPSTIGASAIHNHREIEGDSVKILAKDGDSVLGGRDIDLSLASKLEQRLEQHEMNNLGVIGQGRVRMELLERCFRAKEILSIVHATNIAVQFRQLSKEHGCSTNLLTRDLMWSRPLRATGVNLGAESLVIL
jgi:molecular chaperone DnaK (HSP70)